MGVQSIFGLFLQLNWKETTFVTSWNKFLYCSKLSFCLFIFCPFFPFCTCSSSIYGFCSFGNPFGQSPEAELVHYWHYHLVIWLHLQTAHRGSQLYFHITRYVLKRRREDTFLGAKSESRVSAPFFTSKTV